MSRRDQPPIRSAEEFQDCLSRALGAGADLDRCMAWLEEERTRQAQFVTQGKKQKLDFRTIIEIAQQVASKSLDLQRFETYVVSTFRGQFGVLKVAFLRLEDAGGARLAVRGGKGKAVRAPLELDAQGPFAAFCKERRRPVDLEDPDVQGFSDPELAALRAAGLRLVVPLLKQEERDTLMLLGVLALSPKFTGVPFSDDERALMGVLADLVAVSLNNAQLYQKSIIDGLTQVYSRGHFDAHLFQEISRAARALQSENGRSPPRDPSAAKYVSLVLMDIDHFKKFNDTYGHQTGDLVLREVAACLERSVRDMDIVARYGGEEFAVVFPETPKEHAAMVAERLRAAIAGLALETAEFGVLHVTGSFGVATFPRDAASMQDLIRRADEGLYRSKDAGRNHVSVAPPLAE